LKHFGLTVVRHIRLKFLLKLTEDVTETESKLKQLTKENTIYVTWYTTVTLLSAFIEYNCFCNSYY